MQRKSVDIYLIRQILISLLLLTYTLLNAKIKILEEFPSKPPDWIRKIPEDIKDVCFSGIGKSARSYNEARDIAIVNAMEKVGKSKGFEFSSETLVKTQEMNYKIEEIFSKKIQIKVLPTQLYGLNEVDSYRRTLEINSKIKYEYYILVCLCRKEGEKGLESPTSFSYLWRSAFLPGWGQFYKKEKLKGTLFFLSEALFLSSGFYSKEKFIDYNKKAKNSIILSDREWYNEQSDKYYYISLSSFIVSGALYLYNIFDAYFSEDKRIYAYKKLNLKIESQAIKLSYNF